MFRRKKVRLALRDENFTQKITKKTFVRSKKEKQENGFHSGNHKFQVLCEASQRETKNFKMAQSLIK